MAVESALRQRIGVLLRQNGFMVQPIEDSTTPGVPDLWYCAKHSGRTISGWIELKHVKQMPAKDTTSLFKSLNHGLSIEQVNWIDLCLRHGGNVVILVGYKSEYFLVPGELAETFNDFNEYRLRHYAVQKQNIPDILEIRTR